MADSGIKKRKMWRLFLGGGVLAFSTVSLSATAHIRLTQPISRHPIPETEDGSFLKDGPCGGGDDTRTTDPSRVSTFAPGETITVSWHETVNHDSHYRIAFDDAGQDIFVDPADENDIVEPPVLPVLLDGIPDKSDDKDSFSVQVTLPMTPCDQCTLQLIQYMYGRQQPMYYQCADIVIAAGQTPSEPGLGAGGEASAVGGGDPGDGSGGTDTTEESSGAGGSTSASGLASDPDEAGEDEAGGCTWTPSGQKKTPPRGAAFLGVLLLLSLRRLRHPLRPRRA